MDDARCGWAGSIEQFLETAASSIVNDLYARYPAATLQEAAWHSTVAELQAVFQSLVDSKLSALQWHVLLEYQMPRARDRPLDVCVLTADTVVVIEVKDSDRASSAAVDQLAGYLRDLQEYHAGSRDRHVDGMVLVTRATDARVVGHTLVGGTTALKDFLFRFDGAGISEAEASTWIHSRFEPLPSLIEAAIRIFEDAPLPQIRSINDAEIDETVHRVLAIADESKRNGTNHLVLLTGVPGSGKTLVGMQTVHEFTRRHDAKPRGVMLSGCGPLIEVLQYQLGSKAFVQDIHKFISEYGGSEELPDEHFFVFDEAQRAWDRDYMLAYNKKRRRNLPPQSEPEILLDILGRRPTGACLLAIVGEGQAIYKGEQGGLALWAEALRDVDTQWTLHAPPHALNELGTNATAEEGLHLHRSVRAHRATAAANWVEHVLQANTGEAADLATGLDQAGFWIRITRDLDAAKEHLRTVYGDNTAKTFGMVGSSKARDLAEFGVDLGYFGAHRLRPGQAGPWYVDKPERPAKCRDLVQAAQEFQCQGLELDGCLVLWGRDLSRQDGAWLARAKKVPGVRDPHELRQNAYRVLLSRARDGMVIFVPPNAEMDETAALLEACGATDLGQAAQLPSREGRHQS